MNNTERIEIAKDFVRNLEQDPVAMRGFLEANLQKSIWLQCPPQNGEPVDFWQYGPPIPGAPGFIFLLVSVWNNPAAGGWVVSGDLSIINDVCENYDVYQNFDQAKEAVELQWSPM